MKRLLIATKNQGKLRELSEFLSDLPLEIISLSDLGITDDVEEDGSTYEENARKKALFYAKKSGLPALSDDGGLEIAALNNLPGIKSKRWIGEDVTEEDLLTHMEKIAKELPDENRDARFVNVLALALPSRSVFPGQVWTTRGEISGIIARKPLQEKSEWLQYRLFFFLPTLNKYYHEKSLTPQEMEQVNHRKKSTEAMKPILREQLLSNLIS